MVLVRLLIIGAVFLTRVTSGIRLEAESLNELEEEEKRSSQMAQPSEHASEVIASAYSLDTARLQSNSQDITELQMAKNIMNRLQEENIQLKQKLKDAQHHVQKLKANGACEEKLDMCKKVQTWLFQQQGPCENFKSKNEQQWKDAVKYFNRDLGFLEEEMQKFTAKLMNGDEAAEKDLDEIIAAISVHPQQIQKLEREAAAKMARLKPMMTHSLQVMRSFINDNKRHFGVQKDCDAMTKDEYIQVVKKFLISKRPENAQNATNVAKDLMGHLYKLKETKTMEVLRIPRLAMAAKHQVILKNSLNPSMDLTELLAFYEVIQGSDWKGNDDKANFEKQVHDLVEEKIKNMPSMFFLPPTTGLSELDEASGIYKCSASSCERKWGSTSSSSLVEIGQQGEEGNPFLGKQGEQGPTGLRPPNPLLGALKQQNKRANNALSKAKATKAAPQIDQYKFSKSNEGPWQLTRKKIGEKKASLLAKAHTSQKSLLAESSWIVNGSAQVTLYIEDRHKSYYEYIKLNGGKDEGPFDAVTEWAAGAVTQGVKDGEIVKDTLLEQRRKKQSKTSRTGRS